MTTWSNAYCVCVCVCLCVCVCVCVSVCVCVCVCMQADTGTKMIHVGKNTRSRIVSKGISAGQSRNAYRGLVQVQPGAKGARNSSQCDSLLIGDRAGANTYPYIQVRGRGHTRPCTQGWLEAVVKWRECSSMCVLRVCGDHSAASPLPCARVQHELTCVCVCVCVSTGS